MELPPEVGLRESVDRSRQVSEGDPSIDHQPLDLVEHRHVRGVGCVGAEDPAGHHRVDRRPRGLHQPDLHRGGVGAEHDLSRFAEVDIERVVHVAGRMPRREVQCAEVVPLVFDLWALCHPEAQPDEHVFQLFHGLGDEMHVSCVTCRPHLGQIQAFCFHRSAAFGHLQHSAAFGDRALDGTERIVQGGAHCSAFGWVERTQRAFDLAQSRSLPQVLAVESSQLIERAGRGHGGARLRLDPFDLLDHRKSHILVSGKPCPRHCRSVQSIASPSSAAIAGHAGGRRPPAPALGRASGISACCRDAAG